MATFFGLSDKAAAARRRDDDQLLLLLLVIADGHRFRVKDAYDVIEAAGGQRVLTMPVLACVAAAIDCAGPRHSEAQPGSHEIDVDEVGWRAWIGRGHHRSWVERLNTAYLGGRRSGGGLPQGPGTRGGQGVHGRRSQAAHRPNSPWDPQRDEEGQKQQKVDGGPGPPERAGIPQCAITQVLCRRAAISSRVRSAHREGV